MSKEIEEIYKSLFEYTENNVGAIESYPHNDPDDNFKLSVITGTMIVCTTSIIQMLSLIYEKLEEKENGSNDNV